MKVLENYLWNFSYRKFEIIFKTQENKIFEQQFENSVMENIKSYLKSNRMKYFGKEFVKIYLSKI